MEEKVDVRAIEKRIMTTFHADGIMELFIGLMLSLIWIAKYFDSVVFIAIMPALMIPVVRKLKRKITFPRIGYVDVQGLSGKRSRLKILFLVGTILLGICFAFAINSGSISQETKEAISSAIPFIFSLFFLALFIFLGTVFGAKRFYVYGLLSLILINGANFVGVSPMKSLSIIGIIVLSMGIFTMTRFLRENPILPVEDIGEE